MTTKTAGLPSRSSSATTKLHRPFFHGLRVDISVSELAGSVRKTAYNLPSPSTSACTRQRMPIQLGSASVTDALGCPSTGLSFHSHTIGVTHSCKLKPP